MQGGVFSSQITANKAMQCYANAGGTAKKETSTENLTSWWCNYGTEKKQYLQTSLL